MKLHGRICGLTVERPLIARITTTVDSPSDSPSREVLLVDAVPAVYPRDFALIVARPGTPASQYYPTLPHEFHYLQAGDIIRIGTTGEIAVMYRKASAHNSMLVTERCNSRCVMCSQPPRDVNDDYLIEEWLAAVPLMSADTRELGITGGEPTLHYDNLLALVSSVKTHLSATALHLLTNGRLFAYLKYAQRLAACEHPDLMLGVPLYADVDDVHDFVVQAKGAFGQTVSGILNLARVRQKVEIRFVIHRLTFERLPQFARFVARNLPFVNHIALMGLELMGYARTNLNALWIDPLDYQQQLEEAVVELTRARLNVSIYNLPFCLLQHSLWQYARQSISDWKNMYLPECDGCSVKDFCAGFFASSDLRRSPHVHALGPADREVCLQRIETS